MADQERDPNDPERVGQESSPPKEVEDDVVKPQETQEVQQLRELQEQKGEQDEKQSTRTDKQDIEESEDPEEEEEEMLPPSDPSVPTLTEGSSVPANIIQFQHSFGYDCQRPSNLCALDPNTLCFLSGNLINFLSVPDGRIWFRRSVSGGGLGHLAKNPEESHLAVGERGNRPLIVVFEWPSMEIVALLRGGASRNYTQLNYSPDGELLCSMSGSPDYLATVWDWRKSRIMLRCKSAPQDVFNAAFSSYMPGFITTAGSAHIRFWKMAQTFTGLKLKSEVGRFGKTEVSDVIGVYAMPDQKVVTGCEWGNILVWEAGLIKVEVTKKGRRPCHDAPITQFEYINGELVTVGMDGFVRVWYFETIDLADPPEEDRFVEVEPIFELEVADDLGPASLSCMVRRAPKDPADTMWYAQDSGGGIWRLDLSIAASAKTPERLMTSHAESIAGLAAAPHAPYVATLGKEGRLHVYSTTSLKLILARTFPATGHALIWFPLKVASSGSVLVLACGDGVVRVVVVNLVGADRTLEQHGGTALGTAGFATLLQACRPHRQAATALAISDAGDVLASGGADSTVFVFRVSKQAEFATLQPIGFVDVPSPVTSLVFKPDQGTTLLACGTKGAVTEVQLPASPTHNVAVSFRYTEAKLRSIQFKSVKAQIRRDLYLAQVQARKDAKLEKKYAALEQVRKDNPGLEIDEDAFLADSESEEELEPLYIPAVPATVLWAMYLNDDTLWLSVAGFDAGYVYEYRFGVDGPVRSKMVANGDDVEIHSYRYFYDKNYLLLGMGDGSIRCTSVKEDPTDLADFWCLGMHAPDSPVTAIVLDPSERTLFTVGADGNVFLYSVHPHDKPVSGLGSASDISPPTPAEEVYGEDVPTLEDQSAQLEHERKMKVAAERKLHKEQVLWGLAERYNKMVRRNRALPPSQVIPHADLELDPRITASTHEALEAEAAILRRKLAWDLERARLRYHKLSSFYTDAVASHGVRVRAVRKPVFVETIRQKKLTAEFEAAAALVQLKLEEAARRGRGDERSISLEEEVEDMTLAPAPVESFLRGVSAFEHRFHSRLKRLLDKYHSRKFKRERRQLEWAHFMRRKPDVNKNDPEDEAAIREAEATIGDYKLKSDPDYRVPPSMIVSTTDKYKELLSVRKRLDDVIGGFNAEVLSLRERKEQLRELMANQTAQLQRLHRELPSGFHLQAPHPPEPELDADFPERQYQVREEEVEAEMDRMATWCPRRPVKARHTAEYIDAVANTSNEPDLHVLVGEKDYVLEIRESTWERLVDSVAGKGALHRVDSEVDMNVLRNMGASDATNTSWENEMRGARLMRKLWEQQSLVEDMHRGVRDLDEAIEALAARRLVVQRDVTLLRLRIISLHQELVIIKACEAREEQLSSRVAAQQRERRAVQSMIISIQSKLEGKGRDILRCQEREKAIQTKFFESVADNQFHDYLRRIFKKKYRPPRDPDASSSEESSSSSEEEDDQGDETSSINAENMGRMRLDDNYCPPGCSRELFDLTLELRAQRHAQERAQTECRRDTDVLKKDLDQAGKKLKGVEATLVTCREDLEAFQREKQQRLNEVETVVILRLSQLQHSHQKEIASRENDNAVRTKTCFEVLRNTIVFNTRALTDLDKRVQELNEEAKGQRAKHKKNRKHLHRMVVDVTHMRATLKRLRAEIADAHFCKFGMAVDLTELEQALLRRLVWELRCSASEIRTEFQQLIKTAQSEVRARKEAFTKAVECNTERQNLLLVLTEERNKLSRIVLQQLRWKHQEKETLDSGFEAEYTEDLRVLRSLLATLTARREALIREAVRLRQKVALPSLPSVPTPRPSTGGRRSSTRGAHGPAMSSYHYGCSAEESPAAPAPWPPSNIASLKRPMYLKIHALPETGQPDSARPSATLRSESRREQVRVRLEAGPPVKVVHPQPLSRRSLSLDSLTQGLPGFLSEESQPRDVPPMSEEDALALGDAEEEEGEEFFADDTVPTDDSMEELFRRVADEAQRPVESFLERLGSTDGEDAMMRMVPEEGLEPARLAPQEPYSDDEQDLELVELARRATELAEDSEDEGDQPPSQ